MIYKIIEQDGTIYRVETDKQGNEKLTWLFKTTPNGNFRSSRVVPGMLYGRHNNQFIKL
jgi:hypothetical protein